MLTKSEMNIYAEIASPAAGDNIFKVMKSAVSKKHIKYILGSLIVRID